MVVKKSARSKMPVKREGAGRPTRFELCGIPNMQSAYCRLNEADVDKLRDISSKEHIKVSGIMRKFVLDGIQRYEKSGKLIQNK